MEDREPFWVPDSEVGLDVKNGGGGKKEQHVDRASHSRYLKSSFRDMRHRSSVGISSFEGRDYDVFRLRVMDGVNPDRQDAELSSLGIEVKAVLDDRTLLVSMTKEHQDILSRSIDKYGESSESLVTKPNFLDSVEGFDTNEGMDKYDGSENEDGPVHITIKLIPKMSPEDYLSALPRLRERIAENGGTIDGEFLTEESSPILDVTMDSTEGIEAICSDQAVYRVDKDQQVSLDDFFLTENTCSELTIDPSVDIEGLPIVAVIDSGIDDSSLVRQLVVDRYCWDRKPTKDHGTQVAGRVAFGYGPGLSTKTVTPRCRIIDCNIFHEGILSSEIRNELESIVRKYHHICKVYNLSINLRMSFNHNRISDLAERLDNLQKEFGVVFVISSGNYKELGRWGSIEAFLDSEESEMCIPAESVRSLTVGSAVPCNISTSISKRNMVAPYSRHGPGIGGMVKPDMLAYSANIGTSPGRMASIPTEESLVLGVDKIIPAIGTSFAAPVVASNMAMMLGVLGDEHALMAKTWLIHNAVPTAHSGNVKTDRLGFGILDDWRFPGGGDHGATFVRSGVFSGKFKRHIVHLLVPDCLKGRKCRIILTCMCDPTLDSTRGPGYIRSNISMTLKSNDGSDNITDIKERRSYGNKFSHIQKKEYLRKVEEAVELEVRIQTTLYDEDEGSSLPYVLLATIADDDGRTDVWSGIRESGRYELLSTVLGPIRTRIEIRNEQEFDPLRSISTTRQM